jgi:tRNA G37 N-methylase Trm5
MRIFCRFQIFVAGAVLLSAAAFGQSKTYLADSLAPYVPTPPQVVEKMLVLAELKANETLYDLGAGDGRILITAAQKYNAKGVGIELAPDLFQEAVAKIRSLGLEERIRMIHGNLLDAKVSDADVVTVYLLTEANEKLKPKFEKLRPGARVVSHDFEIRNWVPWKTEKVEGYHKRVHTIYVYKMPPKRLDTDQ